MFNDDMLLVGWVNIETGEIQSPMPAEVFNGR